MQAQTDQLNDNIRRVHRKLTILLRAGMVLMESAADTNRIVRNMRRIAAFLGLEDEHLHIDVLYGTLKVNYSDETHSFSRFIHSDKYTINMKALAAMSQLSWQAIQKDYTLSSYGLRRLLRAVRGRLALVYSCNDSGLRRLFYSQRTAEV